MGDGLFPQGVPMLEPFWRNVVDNPIVVQFVHRWLAWIVAATLLILALRTQRAGGKGEAHAMLTIVALQILLGILTLVTGVSLWIAVAHQAVGALLVRSEEHTSELQSLMRIAYAVICLKKKTN